MQATIKLTKVIEVSDALIKAALEHFYGEVTLDFIKCNVRESELQDEIIALIAEYGDDARIFLPEKA